MDIGSCNGKAERQSCSICKQVTLSALLSSVCRVGAGSTAPERSFGHSPVHTLERKVKAIT